MGLFARFAWNQTSGKCARPRRRITRRLGLHEQLEARDMLSASGFAGNPCAPDLDLSGIPTVRVDAGAPIAINLSAQGGSLTDPETAAADLRWLMDPDVGEDFPTGAALTADGRFTWDTTGVTPGTYEAMIIGIDAGTPALADSETITIVVERPNSPPDVRLGRVGIPDFEGSFVEGQGPVPIVDETLQVIDSDSANLGPVIVTLTGRPDGDEFESLDVDTSFAGFNLTKSYNPATGQLTISGEAFSGIYQGVLRTLTYNNTSANPTEVDRVIRVQISDGEDLSPIRTSIITVTASDANQPPTFDPIDPQNVVVDTTLTVPVRAVDPEGDAIALTLDPAQSPAGATLTDNGDGTGAVTWTPDTLTFPNAASFTVLANGGPSNADGASVTFDATVHPINIEPQLESIATSPITVTAGELFTIEVRATDTNTPAQTLTLRLDPANRPEGAVLTDRGDGTGTITWQTDDGDVGDARFGVLVTDNGFEPLGDGEDFTVTVVAS